MKVDVCEVRSLLFVADHRPTADELEKRESPWCCRSYSVCLEMKFDFSSTNSFHLVGQT